METVLPIALSHVPMISAGCHIEIHSMPSLTRVFGDWHALQGQCSAIILLALFLCLTAAGTQKNQAG